MALLSDEGLLAQYRDGRNLEARIRLHEQFSTNPVGLHPWLLAQMEVPVSASVLELGCGVGSFWATNRDRIPPGWRVTLTDISPGMVAEAERRLSGNRPGFAFATTSAESLPFPQASFDAVFAHFMLYHVENRSHAILEMARVLRRGGQLYAATNGAGHMREAKLLAMQAGLLLPEVARADDASSFNLENGAVQLRAAFSAVELRHYDDHLKITQTEPLVAYIRSIGQVQATLARLASHERENRVMALRAMIDERLAMSGQVVVTKASGVFIAHGS